MKDNQKEEEEVEEEQHPKKLERDKKRRKSEVDGFMIAAFSKCESERKGLKKRRYDRATVAVVVTGKMKNRRILTRTTTSELQLAAAAAANGSAGGHNASETILIVNRSGGRGRGGGKEVVLEAFSDSAGEWRIGALKQLQMAERAAAAAALMSIADFRPSSTIKAAAAVPT